MTYRDFAASIGIPVGTLKRWVHEGLPTKRMGARVVVEPSEAKAWIVRRGRKTGRDVGFVYFAATRPDGLIKIGHSAEPPRRERELEVTVIATVPGSIALERALHRAFRFTRVEGEWFQPTPDLLALIHLLKRKL